ncbi:hypothetical protein QBC33DRAFT_271718 [Phialemonium atrogriseum]|uniref:Secreted protein n=1 Tax=Phialemonium atrogriseum TaxID=1093897 RepID=A0AAJ0C5I8_9PEZI|nr:uncharacterized protein QBC33DRAFT_271718 [Phialemonium atrogriseum]KAK1770559.1 hypothetical protein QBC33DRAFT_271718 [Phialemonium atrogriseum]
MVQGLVQGIPLVCLLAFVLQCAHVGNTCSVCELGWSCAHNIHDKSVITFHMGITPRGQSDKPGMADHHPGGEMRTWLALRRLEALISKARRRITA